MNEKTDKRITIFTQPGHYIIIQRQLFIPSHVFLRGGVVPATPATNDDVLKVHDRQSSDENLPAIPTIEVWSLDDIPGERC